MVVYKVCAYIDLYSLFTVSWKIYIPLKPLERSMSPEVFMKPGSLFLLFMVNVSLKFRGLNVP